MSRIPLIPHSCFTCHWYGAFQGSSGCVECARPEGSPIHAQPEHGCAFWLREPGADDEGDDPERWRRMIDEAMGLPRLSG